MVPQQKIATVFGGTGFIGRYVVRELARAGYTIKIATRIPERAYFLKTAGVVGQIVPVVCNYRDPVSIATVIRGSDLVVNCIGILFEKRRGDFQRIHTGLPGMIAQACTACGVDRLVHLSALGADIGRSKYARSKLAGEVALHNAFPQAVILRPSVVFGPEDEFFNMFAGLARVLPVLPLIGGGKTKFQPVYVGDVAAAVMGALSLPRIGDQTPLGRVYELGGPEVLTLRDVYQRLFAWTGRSRPLLVLPFALARAQAFFLALIPPRPILTPDQVTSLQTDTIVQPGMAGLDDLGVRPTGMELIVPQYLERFRAGGRFSVRNPA